LVLAVWATAGPALRSAPPVESLAVLDAS